MTQQVLVVVAAVSVKHVQNTFLFGQHALSNNNNRDNNSTTARHLCQAVVGQQVRDVESPL